MWRQRNSSLIAAATLLLFAGSANSSTIFTDESSDVQPLPGMLYPRESESREVTSLDGFWDFVVPPSNDVQQGHREKWYADSLSKIGKVMKMPVPSSYNDITTSDFLRDHVGPVWYEKTFFATSSWQNKRVFLRFGSVNYLAEVWLNGEWVTTHEMGHLPFEVEITGNILYGQRNRVTVAVDNRLTKTTIPQGSVVNVDTDNGTVKMQTYTFDFFNYAGIHRPVLLHTKPRVYVDDIDVNTSVINGYGTVQFNIEGAGLGDGQRVYYKVGLLNADEEYVVDPHVVDVVGEIPVPSPRLWWPRSMSDDPGYMYTLEVTLMVPNDADQSDVYRLPVGIRSLYWNSTSFLINDNPIYFRGFGKHEDSALRGRGLDLVTVARDYELLKWVGANAYRTSHYPYSDEILDLADRQGFLIIDEGPGANAENFSPTLLKNHKQSLSELHRRDKNRPSVVMWSIANEPRSQLAGSDAYFKELSQHARSLDSSRPITTSIFKSVTEDKVGKHVDIISFNRYLGWYLEPGRLNMITKKLVKEAKAWFKKYNKPVLVSEYGADTYPGLHELPEYIWSEEYQKGVMSKHFEAFDQLRTQGFFIGEFIWNFADFRTSQKYIRVGGNKKGIFTRDRQPKMVAHHVRKRYHALGKELDGAPEPDDLENYVWSTYQF